jgi:hypothetical protein
MTGSLVVLLAERPELSGVLATMSAVAPDLLVRTACGDKVLRFFRDPVGQDADSAPPLFEVVRPVLVGVPGEVGRLLGEQTARTAPSPPWWVEISTRHDDPFAEQLALFLANALVADCGGTVWSGG